jgi:D-arginine dehydrogenase
MAATTADIIVIGAGMAGASAAAHLAAHARVVLLEREAQPGYHSTGRSAALFTETYGNRTIRLLSRASRAYYEARADGLAEHPILSPRGLLVYAPPEQMSLLDQAWAELAPLGPPVRRLDRDATRAIVPVLRPDRVIASILEPGAMDIDVHGLHQAYLRRLRHAGGRLATDAPATALGYVDGNWTVRTSAGEFAAPIVVNSAGAWADEVARLAGVPPIGLVPKRRTAFIVAAPAGSDSADWPLTGDIEETVYLKPDAGKLLVSPADETPVAPGDVQPEELDIAVAIDRLMRDTAVEVRRVERKWAGLRSFVADHTPVVGFDPLAHGFFWLAGQGGYGIQTAEGMALAAAALIVEKRLPDALIRLGLDAATLSPARFGRR